MPLVLILRSRGLCLAAGHDSKDFLGSQETLWRQTRFQGVGCARRVLWRRRVRRLMEEMNLVAIQPRSFKPRTTDSRHTLGYSPNLLIGAPPPDGVNQLWVGDITYVPLVDGEFLYLSMLMDRFSRRIVGWDLQDGMQESLVLAALQGAIALRRPKPGLLHHTDRGGQYAGGEYRRMLARASMKQKHEPCQGLLRQRLHGIVLRNNQDGVGNEPLSEPTHGAKRNNRIYPIL